jgi:hypothetical protein
LNSRQSASCCLASQSTLHGISSSTLGGCRHLGLLHCFNLPPLTKWQFTKDHYPTPTELTHHVYTGTTRHEKKQKQMVFCVQQCHSVAGGENEACHISQHRTG